MELTTKELTIFKKLKKSAISYQNGKGMEMRFNDRDGHKAAADDWPEIADALLVANLVRLAPGGLGVHGRIFIIN